MPIFERQLSDVAIQGMSETPASGGATVSSFRIDSVFFWSRAEAEAAGHAIARRKKVALWLCQDGSDELLASYRKLAHTSSQRHT